MASQTTPPSGTQAPPPPPPRYYRRRRSWAGPIVLIVIGVVFLFKNLGYAFPLFETWAKWWPLLLIIWGLVKVIEYMQAQREGEPAPGIGAGGVLLIIFVILFGLMATATLRMREHWRQSGPPGFVFNDDDLAELFGSRYQFTQQIDQALPANAKLSVNLDRGDVRVLTGTDDKLHVTVRKTVYAGNQNDANNLNATSTPSITTAGNVVTLQWSGQASVRADMDILLPRAVAVDIDDNRGDLSVTGRDGDLLLQTNKGDVSVDDVKGGVTVHMRSGDLRVARVTGNVVADGRINDTTLEDIGGAVSLSGDFFGDMQANRVAGVFTFHSSRTDLSVAKIEGSFRMSGDSVGASQVTGPVRLRTTSKDVNFDQVAGDAKVDTTNGDVTLSLSKMGNIEVSDRNSNVTVRLPADARFQVDATASNGDASTDFPELKVEKTGNTTRVSGRVGEGGAHVQINNEHADIAIRKQ